LKFADQLNPGDNIFIHGHCVTIGCIPVGDDAIQEIYLMAIRAKSSGQNIPVHIFPSKMDSNGYAALQSEFSSNPTLLDFWTNIKTGYDAFDKGNVLPNVSVDGNGKYVIK
jgi:murein L,D-transpeptidase YafK